MKYRLDVLAQLIFLLLLCSDIEMMSARLARTDYPENIRQTLEKYNYSVQKRESDVRRLLFDFTNIKTDFHRRFYQ